MFSFLFIFFAAILNALMDRVENENFLLSIFKNLNKNFWYKRVSWEFSKKVFGYKLDAWHISKSLMIIFFALAIIFYNPYIPVVDFIIFGIVWNLTFNLFYNHIFLKSE